MENFTRKKRYMKKYFPYPFFMPFPDPLVGFCRNSKLKKLMLRRRHRVLWITIVTEPSFKEVVS
uniref:Putative ovule protein n=1 Tax=Solanum chacoense TaxID=4108 RepID=A0A0V0H115_SOLCH